VHERYEVIGRLADVANGDNPRHLSFQRYVLGAFLDDVLVAASQRLHLMTKSRYRLERTERRFGGKAAAGLNLEVYDAWTGVARPVATLSGGETFQAALSLALGLAEVVQAHAGGMYLETVFVDEGFGSLDDEALDLAVSALMGLGEDGRLVGIISHVSELRERIDARLEITAGKTGSRAAFRVA
jgi:exonuclease SbcC